MNKPISNERKMKMQNTPEKFVREKQKVSNTE